MRRIDTRSDRGLGLAELVVSMALGSVVLAVVATVFVSTLRTVTAVNSTTSVAADARIGMESLTRGLRTAIEPKGETAALLVAKPDEVQVFASLNRPGTNASDPIPMKIAFRWDAATKCVNQVSVLGRRQHRRRLRDASLRVATSSAQTKCLLRTTVPPSFEYFTTGLVETGSPSAPVAPLSMPSGGLALAERNTVVSIGISLTVDDPSTAADHPLTVTDRVTLPNILASLAGGGS